MSTQVLVLNLDNTPFDIWTWQHTMTKMYNGSVMPIHNTDGSIIKHSKVIRDGKGNQYDLPAIVVLKEYIGSNHKGAPYTKMNIYARDMGICQYCGNSTTSSNRTVDHVIPRAHWNPRRFTFKCSSFENVVTCCRSCNLKKRNRTPQKADMKLISKPTRITRAKAYHNKLLMMKNIPNLWKPYVEQKVK